MSLLSLRQYLSRIALLTVVTLAAPPTLGEVTTEAQLKAAYLVNFLKYIEFPGTRTSITLCLFGRDNLGTYLAAYEGRQVGGRELHIRKIRSPEQINDCQELFVPEAEEMRFGALLRSVDRQPILTVSDAESFTLNGGAIALIRSEGRLQFDVNVDILRHNNLKANSQLLRLARKVMGTGR